MPNGEVRNHSSKDLWVVETDTGSAIAHVLAPNRKSPRNVDADGVRAKDGSPISDHNSWWKVRDVSTADIEQSGGRLTINCLLCTRVGDGEFGNVTFDQTPGWGEPLSAFDSSSNACSGWIIPNMPGYVRRINIEPIGMGRERKLVCAAFVRFPDESEVQVFTDDPWLKSALMAAYGSSVNNEPNVKIQYEKDGNDHVLKRIDLIRGSASANSSVSQTERNERVRKAKELHDRQDTYSRGCSDFVCAVLGISWKDANALMGGTPTYVGKDNNYSNVSPGDILGWKSASGSGHVAIYIGESGMKLIDVRNPGDKPRKIINGYGAQEVYKSDESF